MKLLVSFSLSVFMEDSENFRAAPVGSLVFREDTIFKKNCRGSWEAYEEEEAVFLGTMQGPAGMQVPIGGLQYRSELVADTMVWCPVLSAGTAGPSEDPGNLLQELVRSVVQQLGGSMFEREEQEEAMLRLLGIELGGGRDCASAS